MNKDGQFKLEEFFPEELFYQVNELRVHKKNIIREEAKARKRREELTRDGKLTILAADHPARGVIASNGDPLIMGNRHQYLGRILRVITSEEFDGVMGTTDILEDLFLVNYLLKERGKKPFLDNKVLLGCMNRGGISQAIFEMDDRYTSWTAESIHQMGLDGAKLMFRLDLTSPNSCATIDYTAQAIRQLNRYEIPAFVECLPVKGADDKHAVIKTSAALIQVIGIATALGDSSRNIWLKVPYVNGFESVTKSTTCPILILGGAARGDPRPVIEEIIIALKAGKNVRGVLLGRNVLFPSKEDPLSVALAVNGLVHHGLSLQEAMNRLVESRGKDMDRLS
ncbi:MAG: 2-amino-3,7-dideoxy-D-threo-hept-6-ulosonate synthase [Syntrophomonadaceae bacterium]|nr:2-amino-3,7-dideoxy-D-threo-hept-6-ulosonate synthase [Bacillota bacterium]